MLVQYRIHDRVIAVVVMSYTPVRGYTEAADRNRGVSESGARPVSGLAAERGGGEQCGAERRAPDEAAGGRAIAVDGSHVLVGNAAVLLAHVADRVRLSFGWLARRHSRPKKSVQERLCDRLAHGVFNEELLKAAPLARICIQCTS